MYYLTLHFLHNLFCYLYYHIDLQNLIKFLILFFYVFCKVYKLPEKEQKLVFISFWIIIYLYFQIISNFVFCAENYFNKYIPHLTTLTVTGICFFYMRSGDKYNVVDTLKFIHKKYNVYEWPTTLTSLKQIVYYGDSRVSRMFWKNREVRIAYRKVCKSDSDPNMRDQFCSDVVTNCNKGIIPDKLLCIYTAEAKQQYNLIPKNPQDVIEINKKYEKCCIAFVNDYKSFYKDMKEYQKATHDIIYSFIV